MKQPPIPAPLKRRFRGVRISEKALRLVEEFVTWDRARRHEAYTVAIEGMRATVPTEERLAQYNAGYTRAVADLFQWQNESGMQVFVVGGRRVVPDESGRLHLEREDQ
jgi:hypothetical protein